MSNIRVLFFTANWCAVCKNILPAVKATAQAQGVEFHEVNYDLNKSMYESYAAGQGNSLPLTVVEVDNKVFFLLFGAFSTAELNDILETAKVITPGSYFSPIIQVSATASTATTPQNAQDNPAEWNEQQYQAPNKNNSGLLILGSMLLAGWLYLKNK